MEDSKMSLGDVLNAMNDYTIADGDILKNINTDERVIVNNGDLNFLTFNDYVSNVVPLVNGMIDAWWELEESAHVSVSPEMAVEILSNGRSVRIGKDSDVYPVETTGEMFEVLELLGLKDAEYTALRADVEYLNELKEESEQKSRGRTSESEAWAMLIDRYLFDKPVKEIAEKFNTSLRNAYYILDGTYYPNTFKRFNQLVETGELYID